jgi:hypothetical protein
MGFPEILDSTMLAAFKACPQKFFKTYVEDWKPKEPSVHLHAGAAFARGLEVARRAFYEKGRSADDAIAEGLGALWQFYGSFECPPESAKSPERVAGAYEFYWANYPLEKNDPITLPSGSRGIEFSFVEPLPLPHPETGNPILYSGRMDMIANYAGGVFIVDEKTTSYMGPTWSRLWDLRSQFTGYAWGCRQSGIRVDGVVVRGISILKTKYETQESISYRPDWQVERWLDNTCWQIEQMLARWRAHYWPHNLDSACTDYGGCAFRRCCLSQDETPWLETEFVKHKWNPITR